MYFHPKVFDEITNLNSYNMEFSFPKISLALLKTYCQQHQNRNMSFLTSIIFGYKMTQID